MRAFYVYIMASKRNGTLYVGSTTDLVQRVWAHKNKVIKGFTERYYINQLVYYETHDLYVEAARREKRLKNWQRKWKLDLIEKLNPTWQDLYQEICS
jgi:putative endonuclease